MHRVQPQADHLLAVHRAQHEHQHHGQERGVRDAHRAKPEDAQIVHDAVGHRPRHHGVQAVGGALVDDVDAVHELGKAGEHRRQRQVGDELPGVEVAGFHDEHDRAAQPQDARRAAEHDARIAAEHGGKEVAAAFFLGDGGQLPGVVEDGAQGVQNGGQEIAGGQQAAPLGAGAAAVALAHGVDEEHIRCVDDPEADLGRDHGQGEAEHLPPQSPVDAPKVDVAPQLAGKEQKQAAGDVAADDGQQIALGAHVQHHQVQHIEHQGRKGAQHPVDAHQTVQFPAADELGAEGAQAAGEDVNAQKDAVVPNAGGQAEQRPAEQQHRVAQQDGQQAVGEHLLFAVALVQAKADDGVGHPHRHQRDEQVGALAQQLRDAHALHIPHGVGQKGLDDQGQQFGRKAGDGKDHGVAGQLGIFILPLFRGVVRFQRSFTSVCFSLPAAGGGGLSSRAGAFPPRPRRPGCGWAPENGRTHAPPHTAGLRGAYRIKPAQR